MDSKQLKRQAITIINQLTAEKLAVALDHLSNLQCKDSLNASQDFKADSKKLSSLHHSNTVEEHNNINQEDPILTLLGTVKLDVENISDRHYEMIEDAL